MKNIYVCGPTVYSEPHIGNMRPILIFDIYIRSLRFLKTEVNFIHNITDVDDKIIARALKENTTEEVIAAKYRKQYENLLDKLNVVKPNHMPNVSSNIDLIIDFINKLVKQGSAYVNDGNVYFDVGSVDGYGNLSNRKLSDMKYEDGLGKKNPADFALWKKTDVGIKFDSPWGPGRPGWHTECVVFIEKYLQGKPLDLHGGGIDLLFPHHENENIQYKALYQNEITKEWRHVGHLNYEGEKMSKSLGNLISASDFIATYGPDTLRHIFLTTSYSAPVNLSKELIDSAREQVEKIERVFKKAQLFLRNIAEPSDNVKRIMEDISNWNHAKAMKDFNVILKEFNTNANQANASDAFHLMILFGYDFTNKRVSEHDKLNFREWEIARQNKNFELADKLREELKELGIF